MIRASSGLAGSRLRIAWAAYSVLLMLAAATFIHATPQWIDASLAHRLEGATGATPSPGIVWLDIVAAMVVPVACVAVAAVILRYRSRDWFGLFASVEAILFGCVVAGPWSSVPLSDPWSLPTRIAIKLAEIAILMALFTFPNGRFVPSWTRLLLGVFVAWTLASLAVTSVDPVIARGIWQLALVLFVLGGVAAQAYRYTRVSAGVEKRQAAWVFAGLALIVVAYAIWSIAAFVARDQTVAVLADIALQLASIVAVLLFGVAMIRYRLYDIDLVLNRTILYGSATAVLLIGFVGLSQIAKTIIQGLTGHSSDIVSIPLLVVAALAFAPLQRSIRPVVDRLLPPRAVLTLLFTDICESTAHAVRLGDDRWRETLANYRATVRRGLRRFKGNEMDTAGDGFFAVFDRATDGLNSAEWLRDRLRELTLDSRFGLHAGECETRGEKVSGVAVIAAARVMAIAGSNEILVSAAMREALSTDGDGLTDLGEHDLKGLPGRWRLYRLVPSR